MPEALNEEQFFWVDSNEPHAQRRKAVLAKYGNQIRKLYGYDNRTAYQVMAVMAIQFAMAYHVRSLAWWKVVVLAYTVSGTCNQNLLSAQHEISHFLALKKPYWNKVLAVASNCPIVVPMATKFRQYHQEHHSHLGVEGWDVDLPTGIEANIIAHTVAKICWMFVYILVYGIRPLIIRPKPVGIADVINWGLVLTFDGALLYTCGFKSLLYLLMGTVFGGGLHPIAGHLIQEHYMFVTGQETYSYYGPLNRFTYNVGYHNEHHDFPQIPQTRLHELREIAPEFYTPLQCHTSWCWVIWKFIVDPAVGPWTRMKRETREGTEGGQEPIALHTKTAFADITNLPVNASSGKAVKAA